MTINDKKIDSTPNTNLREARLKTRFPVGDGKSRIMRQIDLKTSLYNKFQIKISVSSISAMEAHGAIPHMAVAYAIADILNKPVDILFPKSMVLESWKQKITHHYWLYEDKRM